MDQKMGARVVIGIAILLVAGTALGVYGYNKIKQDNFSSNSSSSSSISISSSLFKSSLSSSSSTSSSSSVSSSSSFSSIGKEIVYIPVEGGTNYYNTYPQNYHNYNTNNYFSQNVYNTNTTNTNETVNNNINVSANNASSEISSVAVSSSSSKSVFDWSICINVKETYDVLKKDVEADNKAGKFKLSNWDEAKTLAKEYSNRYKDIVENYNYPEACRNEIQNEVEGNSIVKTLVSTARILGWL